MDMAHNSEGQTIFRLGPVERWVVGAIAIAFVSFIGWGYINMSATMERLVVGQALANAQLLSMGVQLAGVPTLAQQVAQNAVRIERNTQDIHDLQSTGKLR